MSRVGGEGPDVGVIPPGLVPPTKLPIHCIRRETRTPWNALCSHIAVACPVEGAEELGARLLFEGGCDADVGRADRFNSGVAPHLCAPAYDPSPCPAWVSRLHAEVDLISCARRPSRLMSQFALKCVLVFACLTSCQAARPDISAEQTATDGSRGGASRLELER